jgi:hypothetical protein
MIGVGVVLLFFGGKPLAFIEDDCLLSASCLYLPGLVNRRDELRAAAAFRDSLRGLDVFAQFPVGGRGIRTES